MDKVLVSIIIPARNEEENIGRLLASIKRQSYIPIETVVVDDGSSDKTFFISKKFTNKVYRRKFSERSAQRNFGASVSKGKYLLFLDADMELTPEVVNDSLRVTRETGAAMVTIAERTVGNSFIARVRKFERETYMGDKTIEVPRFFEKKAFLEFGGYDENLTGPEDYDLPYRMSKKNSFARSDQYILHHEENLTLSKLLKKKYYYGQKGALYAKKHPELILTQGNLLFRKAYFRNWKKFLTHPFLGATFIVIRALEMFFALAGFLSSLRVLKLQE